tara:strand:+ start:610 stop:786 length:177 start_codon:yes stop_codon:yes gene_type:complete
VAAKKPYKTPWDGNAEKRLDEDRQWSELSRLIQQGIIGDDSCVKVARLWLRRKIQRTH